MSKRWTFKYFNNTSSNDGIVGFTEHEVREPGVYRLANGRLRYIPVGYTPNYSYPLVVWLFASAKDEQAFWNWMPVVSERNYLAVSVRTTSSFQQLSENLRQQINDADTDCSFHSGRIFLVGVGDAANDAMQIYDRYRLRFAGCHILPLPENSKQRDIEYSADGKCPELRQRLLDVDRQIMRTIDTSVHPE